MALLKLIHEKREVRGGVKWHAEFIFQLLPTYFIKQWINTKFAYVSLLFKLDKCHCPW